MLLWLVPSWLLSVLAAGFLGFYLRGIVIRVTKLEESIKAKVDKPVKLEEPKSEVLDPEDPIQQAKWEHEAMMRKLNNE